MGIEEGGERSGSASNTRTQVRIRWTNQKWEVGVGMVRNGGREGEGGGGS